MIVAFIAVGCCVLIVLCSFYSFCYFRYVCICGLGWMFLAAVDWWCMLVRFVYCCGFGLFRFGVFGLISCVCWLVVRLWFEATRGFVTPWWFGGYGVGFPGRWCVGGFWLGLLVWTGSSCVIVACSCLML